MEFWVAVLLGGLTLVVLGLIGYLALVRSQLRSITAQLRGRVASASHAPVTVQLFDGSLDELVAELNLLVAETERVTTQLGREELAFRALISNISHDLRTPLTAVRGYQQLLARGELGPRQREQLEVARRRADELGQLIDQLFEYSYLLETTPASTLTEVEVSGLVAERLLSAVTPLEEAGLEVSLDAPEQIIIRTDVEQLGRIIDNLVGNAAKHATGWLRVQISHSDDQVQLVFANPVPEPESIEPDRLFERFFTSDRSRQGRGTGLGLSIVKLLVDNLGGEVNAALDANVLRILVRLPLRTRGSEPGSPASRRTTPRCSR